MGRAGRGQEAAEPLRRNQADTNADIHAGGARHIRANTASDREVSGMMNLEQLEATEKKMAAILAESGATLPEVECILAHCKCYLTASYCENPEHQKGNRHGQL